MGYRTHGSTAIAGLVLASLVAPMAHADSGPWIRYKQGYPSPVQTRVYHRGSGSSVVPAIAGFIGGLVVGSQLHAAPVRERVVYTEPVCERERVVVARPYCPEPVYYEDTNYYDPYNDDWYGSLDQCYESESRYSEGPRFVVEISARTGQCLNTYSWNGGGWRACGSDSYWNGCTRRNDDRYRHGGWDRRTYYNRYGDNNRDWNRHDNRGGRGRGRWSEERRWSNEQGDDD